MSFFKNLLQGAMGTGAAYLRHVKLANTAIAASPDKRSGLLTEYVQGLSDASFAGFKATLALLSNQENDAQKKYAIQSLLQNADAARGGTPQTIQTQQITANEVEDTKADPDFDRDLKLVSHWFGYVPKEQWKALLVDHLITLDSIAYATFAKHLERMKGYQLSWIKYHKDNEHGYWAEDRIRSKMFKLRTGKSDPQFLKELGNLELALRNIEWAIKSSHDLWRLIQDKRAASSRDKARKS